MNAEEFAKKTVIALDKHWNELQAMEAAIMATVPTRAPVPNLNDIFREFAEAARECAGTLEYYGESGPLPDTVRIAVVEVQEAIDDCASALVLATGVVEGSE